MFNVQLGQNSIPGFSTTHGFRHPLGSQNASRGLGGQRTGGSRLVCEQYLVTLTLAGVTLDMEAEEMWLSQS